MKTRVPAAAPLLINGFTMEQINEGNKLIASFLGKKTEYNSRGFLIFSYQELRPEYVHYHDDWDSLMMIVEYIELYNYGFKMCRKVVEVYFDDTKEVILKTKECDRITSLWKALVEFAKVCGTKGIHIA